MEELGIAGYADPTSRRVLEIRQEIAKIVTQKTRRDGALRRAG